MTDDELKRLYGSLLERTGDGRSPECPSPERLRATAEGEADADERLTVMNHVAACLPCQRDLALLAQIVAARPRPRRTVQTAWLAAAATVVLAFVGIRALGPRGSEMPVLRGDGSVVTTVSPAGDVTASEAGTLVWRAVPGATRFEVEVLTSEGVVVHSATVRDTVALVPPGVARSGSYRWRVTALRADGTRTESALVTFTIPPG